MIGSVPVKINDLQIIGQLGHDALLGIEDEDDDEYDDDLEKRCLISSSLMVFLG